MATSLPSLGKLALSTKAPDFARWPACIGPKMKNRCDFWVEEWAEWFSKLFRLAEMNETEQKKAIEILDNMFANGVELLKKNVTKNRSNTWKETWHAMSEPWINKAIPALKIPAEKSHTAVKVISLAWFVEKNTSSEPNFIGMCLTQDATEADQESPPPLRPKRRRTFRYNDGRIYQGEAEGRTPQGQGKLTYPDGGVYEGEFRDGVFEGFGKRTFGPAFGIKSYEGQWQNGSFHGDGILTYRVKRTTRNSKPQVIRYEGNFHLGSRQGMGILTFDNGSIYDGGFENDLIRGAGSLEQNGIVRGVNTGEDGIMRFLQ